MKKTQLNGAAPPTQKPAESRPATYFPLGNAICPSCSSQRSRNSLAAATKQGSFFTFASGHRRALFRDLARSCFIDRVIGPEWNKEGDVLLGRLTDSTLQRSSLA